jgi:hypothetical protein
MPLGLDAALKLPEKWTLGLNAEFDWLLAGLQKSRMGDVNPAYNNITSDQTEGFGVRFSARMQKDFAKTGIFIEPFWRYWHVQESEISYLFTPGTIYVSVEPQNETFEWGLKIGLAF